MTRPFSAAMRRATRLMRASSLKTATKSARNLQKSMAGLVARTMLSALPDTAVPKVTSRKRKTKATAGSLGSVITQLASTAKPRPVRAVPTKSGPAGAQMQTHTLAGRSRQYRIILPATQRETPKGLLLMLHGCGQTIDDFALGTGMKRHADKHGLVLVYVAQTTADNAAACWNWFRPDNQVRGKGEPALLASLARKITKQHGLDRQSVFVAGLSAGGAMAAILADVYPDVFSAAGIHSGLARGSAHDVLSAVSAMRKGTTLAVDASRPRHPGFAARRIIFHGDSDSTVHPSNAESLVAHALGDDAVAQRITRRQVRGRGYARSNFADADGRIQLELWTVEGAGHAWSGGKPAGSYTDANGPDASAQMIRFFLEPGR